MLDLELDFTKEVVTIRLAGPESVWFGVGFEALTMADRPYVIIVDGKTGAFQERKLGKYGAGEPLVTTLEEVSPPAHINGLCYVELRRPLASASLKHTSFEPPISVMNIVAAVGEFRQFGQHGPHRAAWMLRFVRDVQLPTSWVPTTMAPVGSENATTVTTTTSRPQTASTTRPATSRTTSIVPQPDGDPATATQVPEAACTSEAAWSTLKVGTNDVPLVPHGPTGSVLLTNTSTRDGASTWQFDGTGYLGATLDMPLGAGDWTIEAWLRMASDRPVECWRAILSIGHGHETVGGITLYQPKEAKPDSGYANTFAMFFDKANVTVGSHQRIDDDAWHHLALARAEGVTRLFVDGIEEYATHDNHTYTETEVYLGADPDCNESFFKGFLHSIRIVPGAALYPLAGCEATTTALFSTPTLMTTMPLRTTEPMAGPTGTQPPVDTQPVPSSMVSRGVTTFGSVNVTLDLELDPSMNMATIRLRGPSNGWYGVGFGAAGMAEEPYAIIVDGSSGTYQERKLGKYSAGEPLSSSLEDVFPYIHLNGYCEVELQRPLKGVSAQHYTFDASVAHATLNVIAAFGESFSLAYHDAKEVGELTLVLSSKADTGGLY